MYESLPEFVKKADFCITLKGLKYAYDPFKRYKISALDPFYPFDVMVKALEEHAGGTLGLKVGSANVSAIDIDNCFINGSLAAHAADIIEALDVYTEFSPSGNGIRLLFKTTTPFDIEKYYVKNSALGIEYYDARHCSTVGARMVRISGNMIHPGAREEVSTLDILERYMKRPVMNKFQVLGEAELNENRAKVLAYLVNILPEFYEYNARLIDHKSESEWDLSMVNMISAYTSSRAEVDYALKNSKYFLTKDERHRRKWDKEAYIEGTYSRIGQEAQNSALRDWLDAFDDQEPLETPSSEALTSVLQEIGIIKVLNRSNAHKNLAIGDILSALIYCADKNINARVWREMKANK